MNYEQPPDNEVPAHFRNGTLIKQRVPQIHISIHRRHLPPSSSASPRGKMETAYDFVLYVLPTATIRRSSTEQQCSTKVSPTKSRQKKKHYRTHWKLPAIVDEKKTGVCKSGIFKTSTSTMSIGLWHTLFNSSTQPTTDGWKPGPG